MSCRQLQGQTRRTWIFVDFSTQCAWISGIKKLIQLSPVFGWQMPCVEILQLCGSFTGGSRSTAWNIIIEQLLLKKLAVQEGSYPDNLNKAVLDVCFTTTFDFGCQHFKKSIKTKFFY